MTQPAKLRVFVYGTLKPGEANYQRYCQNKVLSEIPAYTLGDLYALPVGYPAMTQGSDRVRGVLLTFDDPNILKSLDRLEGYRERRVADLNEYYRLLVSVYRLDRQPLGKAWAYFMTPAKVGQLGGIKVTSGFWTCLSSFAQGQE
ncbi:gamma-glutamylcyclotransferase [Pleurocapsales cyanobacterium LEGE 10410]|nr:gamma-glutamylcyclotransferase [Pleurocapsales cyanobacterium LEGE 10410]